MEQMSRSERKLSHIQEAISQQRAYTNSFDDVQIVHQSLSGRNWEDLSLQVKFGELHLSSPLFINAMTGGGGLKTEEINRKLATVAKEKKITIAVGSQMAALKDKEQVNTYKVMRKVNPNGVIFANVGSEATLDQANKAVEMVEANALQIHLNILQELIMPEGDRQFSDRLRKLEDIVSNVEVPVIVKEVGFGISKETAKQLEAIGVQYIDVSGYGGTNFSVIENKRRTLKVNPLNEWGIPTVPSILEVAAEVPSLHIAASGGIRHGIDGVKAFVLGASLFGMAGSLLKVLMEHDEEELATEIESIHTQFKIALVALGARTPKELRGKPHVFFGKTKEWYEQRINSFPND